MTTTTIICYTKYSNRTIQHHFYKHVGENIDWLNAVIINGGSSEEYQEKLLWILDNVEMMEFNSFPLWYVRKYPETRVIYCGALY